MVDVRRTVVVPDLVGQPVHIARHLAAEMGLGLVSGDLDGPGIGTRTWPGLFLITGQDPLAGSIVARGSQVQVEFVEYDGTGGRTSGSTWEPVRRARAVVLLRVADSSPCERTRLGRRA